MVVILEVVFLVEMTRFKRYTDFNWDLSNSLEEVGLGKKKNTTTHKISAQIVSPNHYIKYNCNKPHGKMVFLSDKGS